MKKAIYLFSGIILTTFISATTVSVMTVKPQQPKSTIVKPIRAIYGIENEISKYVKQKISEGYIVKEIAIIDDETWSKGVIVMEKY